MPKASTIVKVVFIGLLIGMIGLLFLLHCGLRTQRNGASSVCCAQLRQIHAACIAYAGIHDGQLPPDLKTLGLGSLYCPVSRRKSVWQQVPKTEYHYLGQGLTLEAAKATHQVLVAEDTAHEAPGFPSEGPVALMACGCVIGIPPGGKAECTKPEHRAPAP